MTNTLIFLTRKNCITNMYSKKACKSNSIRQQESLWTKKIVFYIISHDYVRLSILLCENQNNLSRKVKWSRINRSLPKYTSRSNTPQIELSQLEASDHWKMYYSGLLEIKGVAPCAFRRVYLLKVPSLIVLCIRTTKQVKSFH